MLKRFQSYIIEKGLFKPSDQLLVAVSGGVDSVTLCDLLFQSGHTFAIAHCNFQLRGKDSEEDMRFVKELAEKYHVPFYCKHFDTQQYIEHHKVSTQLAARDLRYEWFRQLLTQHQLAYLVTAHHASDVTETMLINITRGTGIAGLHGILNKANNIIRPLIFASKEEVLSYAKEKNLSWREDVSNASDKYTRNFLRNQVIPLLKTINPQLEKSFSETAVRINDVESFVKHQVEAIEKDAVILKGSDVYITISSFLNLPGKSSVLYEIIRKYQFSWHDTEEIIKGLNSICGKKFYSSTHVLVKDRNHWIITKTEESFCDENIKIDNIEGIYNFPFFKLTVSIYPNHPEIVLSQNNTLMFNHDSLHFPLYIRKWQHGDVFQPLGLKGRKKISDYLIDRKIPVNIKERTFLIISNDIIVGILGMSVGEKHKIKSDTKTIIQLSVEFSE